MKQALLVALVALLCVGCSGFFYQPMNVTEALKMIEATEGSGCVYFRGNSRPYADISFLTIHAYGKNAPKYLDCLEAVPPEARGVLSPQ